MSTVTQGPLDIRPEALADEALQVQRKLGAGLNTLREVDDVDYGATTKEAVWSDGKVVLYRYRGEHAPTAKVPCAPVVCSRGADRGDGGGD